MFVKPTFSFLRYGISLLSFVVKKYAPQTEVIKDVVGRFVSGGIILHEFQKHDFYRGKKMVMSEKI